MKVTYKTAEGFCLLAPLLFTYVYKTKIHSFLTEYLMVFRIIFVASVMIDLSLAYWIKQQILKHNVQTKIRFSSDSYVMVTKEKKEKLNEKGETVEEDDENNEIEMSVCEYDSQVISTHISKTITSTLIYTAMHLAIKSPQPIMMLIFNPVKDLLFFPLYIEYLRGKKMLRPFSRNIMFTVGEEKGATESDQKVKEAEEPAKELDEQDDSSFSISDDAKAPVKGGKAKKEE